MHQIKWHDVRGDRGNEPRDYSSKWKPISIEKVRQWLGLYFGKQFLDGLLSAVASGEVLRCDKFSIRRDPASVVPVVAVPVKPVKQKVPADAQLVIELNELEAWTGPFILERIQRYLDKVERKIQRYLDKVERK